MGYYRGGGYYQAGGYYRAGSLRSLVGSIGKTIGGLGIPVVSGVAGTVGRLAMPTPIAPVMSVSRGTPATLSVTGTGVDQRPRPGVRGRVQRLLPGGESGYLPTRHMNAGNAKAARRAIRRITSVRKLLKSIERQLPMRPAPRGRSPGVITRSEAARALRS